MVRWATCATVCVVVGTLLAGPPAFGAAPVDEPIAPVRIDSPTGSYIVVLDEAPVATYEGGEPGLAATMPRDGEKLDPHSAEVRRYAAFLAERQAAVASEAGVQAAATYMITLNGFSVIMSPARAARVAVTEGVLAVYPDEILRPDATTATDAPRQPAPDDDPDSPDPDSPDPDSPDPDSPDADSPDPGDAAGAGVVVGVIDTGIAPENPAFAGDRLRSGKGAEPHLVGDTVVFAKADGREFRSERSSAAGWTDSDYSTKLIGARHFSAGALAAGFSFDHDTLSPRDVEGHGSHVAGIAAGNAAVQASAGDIDLGVLSGMAPAAKIAAYKACFTGGDPLAAADDVCVGSDVVSAVEQAVADGVDVIAYAVGGRAEPGRAEAGPAEGGRAEGGWGVEDIALYNAAVAGVFVAASAGNAGPGAATTAGRGAPWYTTVAASTTSTFEATVQLSTGFQALGVSMSLPAGAEVTGLVRYAGDAALANAADANLCYPGTLDPAVVSGAIVICDRGTNPRTEKSQEVADAGGIGMILANVTPDSLDSEPHAVPTVHIDAGDRAALRQELAGGTDITATLIGANATQIDAGTPQIAGFSSRGPSATDHDVLTPDAAAPGAGILGAAADSANGDPTWSIASGTSMAAGYTAGAAARYLGAFPRATPDEIKSAIMTSAGDTAHADGSAHTDPFAQGAGQVDAIGLLDPALLYRSGPAQWAGYLKGRGLVRSDLPARAGRDINLPSITLGGLAGEQTVTRALTATRPGTYRAAASIPGVDVTVQPAALSFARAGETKEFAVTIANVLAPAEVWATGFLTWSGEDGTSVRSPLAVRPAAVDAEPVVSAEGIAGSIEVTVQAQADGVIPLDVVGLAPVELLTDGSVPGHSGDQDSGDENGNAGWVVQVPEGSSLARFALRGSDDSDLHLSVYRLVGPADARYHERWTPAVGAADEVTLPHPAAGSYLVVANVREAAGAMTWDLTAAVVRPDGARSLTAAQDELSGWAARTARYALSWQGLLPGTRYLGAVTYGDTDAQTVVEIDAGMPPPQTRTAPAIVGNPRVGDTLTVSPGAWEPDAVDLAHRWLRNGQPIPDADGARYRVTAADVGAALSVQETASRPSNVNAGTAVSDEVIVKAGSSVEVTMRPYRGTTAEGYAVTVDVTTALGARAEGSMVVRVDATEYTGTLAEGRVTFTLPAQRTGIHVVVAEYAGNAQVEGATGVSGFVVVR
ncbi:S8 family serine peptidase [Microbacterium sp. zg.B48]|uniref:S8 family serine peptidase n=1 Tax=Microbacterium sp. zg.B48 TaxID=2969408 RepID=UPI00214B5AD4|nr:S8 family serine peptidase [Microbacterium sp. zg.B48]MCR2764894.1 S8 family serine peptidase [Microbacterium sp. zg.B48]